MSLSMLARGLCGLMVLVAAAGRLEARTETYAVDAEASHVRIRLGRSGLLKFLGHDHDIEAPVAEGRIEVVDGDPARSRVALRFESARLAVVPGSEPADDVPKVEERMHGPEVLDVARYPEVAFASTSVEVEAKDGPGVRVVVTGTLTLRERSFPVEIPLEVVLEKGARLTARGGVDLHLRDLGIEPPSVAGVVKVANRFRLELEIEARAVARP